LIVPGIDTFDVLSALEKSKAEDSKFHSGAERMQADFRYFVWHAFVAGADKIAELVTDHETVVRQTCWSYLA
jgi:hypothetical protein